MVRFTVVNVADTTRLRVRKKCDYCNVLKARWKLVPGPNGIYQGHVNLEEQVTKLSNKTWRCNICEERYNEKY